MDSLRVDISRILRLDVPRYKQRLASAGPPRRQLGSIERPVLTTAISAAARVSTTARILKEVSELADTGRRVAVTFTGGSPLLFRLPRSTSPFTLGIGSSASAFAGIGVSVGSGLYGSNSPELGIYDSFGGGIWSNAGVSGGMVVTYVFGPPSAFGGMSWSIGVGCDIPGVGVGVGGALLFGASGPPFDFLGYCVSVSAGISLIPVEVSFQVSNTRLRPIT